MTVVVPSPWHVCGTPTDVSAEVMVAALALARSSTPTRDAMPPRSHSPLSGQVLGAPSQARYDSGSPRTGLVPSPRPKTGGNTRQRRGAAG